MLNKQPTLKDVAALAGVSYQTVSRVINGSVCVSIKTKEAVFTAMKSLNYTPNRVAQQLAGKKSSTIGLATADISLHAPSQIAASVKVHAEELKYSVVIAMAKNQSLNIIDHVINELLEQRVDGIIVNIPSNSQQIIQIQHLCRNIPVLFMDVDPKESCLSVMTDSREGGQQGITHLIEFGHTSIALITGPQSSVSARLRFDGWIKTLQKHHISPISIQEGDWSAASGYALTKALCYSHQHPTAICFANDQMALGGLRALHELRIQIPEQISVIGYDDTEDSAFFYPPLTTIAQDFKELGKQAVEKLLHKMNAPESNTSSLVLPTSLVKRETSTSANSLNSTNDKEFAKQLYVIAGYLSARS